MKTRYNQSEDRWDARAISTGRPALTTDREVQMAVKPNEIPVVEEEIVEGAGVEPVAPADELTEPELPTGEFVPLEDFRRLEGEFNELRSIEHKRTAGAEERAEDAAERAERALRYAEQIQAERERDGEFHLASLDEEERAKARPGFEAWKAEQRAELEKLRKDVNVPARERRKVADKFGIDVKELGDLEDPVELRDKALEVLKAQRKEEAVKPEEEPTPRRKVTTTRGPLQPTGGAAIPKPPPRVDGAMIKEAAARGDITRVRELRKQLQKQRQEDEKVLRR